MALRCSIATCIGELQTHCVSLPASLCTFLCVIYPCYDGRCTADGVYLRPLADKFVRLVMQLLVRYTFWLLEGMSARQAATSAASAQSAPVAAPQVCAHLHHVYPSCYLYFFHFLPGALLSTGMLCMTSDTLHGAGLLASAARFALCCHILHTCMHVRVYIVLETVQDGSSWGSRASPEQFALVRADVDGLSDWTQHSMWPSLGKRLELLTPNVSIGKEVLHTLNRNPVRMYRASKPMHTASTEGWQDLYLSNVHPCSLCMELI